MVLFSACICALVIHTLCVVSSFHSTHSLWTCLLCIKTVVYSPFLSNRLEVVFHCFLFVYGSVLVKLNPITILNTWQFLITPESSASSPLKLRS